MIASEDERRLSMSVHGVREGHVDAKLLASMLQFVRYTRYEGGD